MYIVNGRQYFVVMSPGGVVAGQAAAGGQVPTADQGLSPDTPRGYIAFTLPR